MYSPWDQIYGGDGGTSFRSSPLWTIKEGLKHNRLGTPQFYFINPKFINKKFIWILSVIQIYILDTFLINKIHIFVFSNIYSFSFFGGIGFASASAQIFEIVAFAFPGSRASKSKSRYFSSLWKSAASPRKIFEF